MRTSLLDPCIPILILILIQANSLSPDGLSLLAFKLAVTSDPTSALSGWSRDDADPCRWPGISCANLSGSSRVVGIAVSAKNLSGYIPSELGALVFLRRLNLRGNRLSGPIPTQLFNASQLHSIFLYDNSLSGPLPPSTCNLPLLQNLDLSRNSLSGPLPYELRDCRQLQRLNLGGNRLSGGVPAGVWPRMLDLVQLDLSSNRLNGSLPPDLGSLVSLAGTLNLSRNGFSGRIPDSLGKLPDALVLDLTYNNLSGEIPGSLSTSAFLADNPFLCGAPLRVSCSGSGYDKQPPMQGGGGGKRAVKTRLILMISAADVAGVAAVGVVVVCLYWKLKDGRSGGCCNCIVKIDIGGSEKEEDGDLGLGCCLKSGSRRWRGGWGEEEEEGGGRLVSMNKGFKVEVDELLRSSAYVLGKGGLGIVYKVVLGSGVPVAVRRLGEGEGGMMRYGDFAVGMKEIGKVRHGNIVRLRGYYWAPNEKLLITDFVSNGNLASALKGRPGQTSLTWPIRLRIAKGAAHGLNYLHECNPRKFFHGRIKPSNILLDADYNPYVSDFGLFRLVSIATGNEIASSSSPMGPTDRPNNNYRAPEARLPGARPSQKWDVYSFGVVLLELVTGKIAETSTTTTTPATSSSTSLQVDPVADLVRRARKGFEGANAVMEMVDPTIRRVVHAKKEVLSMFRVALECTETDPEMRPKMKTVADSLDRMGG